MASTWRVRRYEAADGPKVDELLRVNLPGYGGRDKWDWMHRNNPLGFHGPDGDILVAEASGGDLVGYFGALRYSIRCFGKTVVGAQGLNMVTHPDFRKQGIATQLTIALHTDAQKNGVSVGFAFPNAASYPLAIKQGAIDLGDAKELHLVLDREAYESSSDSGTIRTALRKVESTFTGLGSSPQLAKRRADLEVVEGFAEDAGSVWDSVRDGFDLGLERTPSYLSWRYHRRWGEYQVLSATRSGESLGYAVTGTAVKKDVRLRRIHELIAKDDDSAVYGTLLARVLDISLGEGAAFVSVSASCTPGCVGSLRAAGFQAVGRGTRYVVQPYEEGLADRLSGARAYHSLGDRDYL